MSLLQSTTIYSTELLADGTINVLLHKNIIRDGVIISFENHRTCLVPTDDVVARLTELNTNLTSSGYEEISSTDWAAKITAISEALWTDDLIADYKAAVAAATTSAS